MALEIRRKIKESSQGLVRRFSKRIRRSGILVQARKVRFRQPSQSNQAKKRSALRKEGLRKKYEKLEKLGELKYK